MQVFVDNRTANDGRMALTASGLHTTDPMDSHTGKNDFNI